MRTSCKPSQFPRSEVPQDSHFPNSRGRPRKGFESCVAWLIDDPLTDAVHCTQQKQKIKNKKYDHGLV